MKLPAEVEPASWGFVGGAVAAIAVGFFWGGWATMAGAKDPNEAVARACAATLAS